MLRILLLVLLLTNGLYYAWSEGLLKSYGFAPAQQREPQRLAQQLRPEALQILQFTEQKSAEMPAQADSGPRECLQAGPFDDAQSAALRNALGSALASGSWQFEPVTVPARWIVYMGKFASAEAMAKKRAELTAMQLVPQSLENEALEPGLSLGGFATRAAANDELERLSQRGIRTARVAKEQSARVEYLLTLPALTPEMKSRLNDLRPVLAGKPMRACQ